MNLNRAFFSKRFGNFGLEFEIYFWVQNFEDQYPTESEIVDNLDKALQDKKITVAFRGIKVKYKPKGDEAAQLNAQREALKEKRRDSSRYFKAAALRRHRNLLKLEERNLNRAIKNVLLSKRIIDKRTLNLGLQSFIIKGSSKKLKP